MTINRTLTGLAMAAAIVAIAPAAAQAATGATGAVTTGYSPAGASAVNTSAGTSTSDSSAGAFANNWGAYYAPGKRAKALGSLSFTGEDHEVIPTADTVKISGKVYDLSRSSACGWAVFRITYRDDTGNLPFKHRSILDCSYGSPKSFSFTSHDVYQVELKVCSEGKASKPSLNCLYAGTWKTLYLSK
ncbi:hypothetical protein AB0M95_10260 [Sphaerisporangium sp. NPDC051017]|uniref:hypothetical protein n=1 Tax=unclassified Sphaerisporangium TaxID=2630420 RepID=UPI00340D3638